MYFRVNGQSRGFWKDRGTLALEATFHYYERTTHWRADGRTGSRPLSLPTGFLFCDFFAVGLRLLCSFLRSEEKRALQMVCKILSCKPIALQFGLLCSRGALYASKQTKAIRQRAWRAD